MNKLAFFSAMFFYATCAGVVLAQDAGMCSQGKALEVAKADPAVSIYCTGYITRTQKGCNFNVIPASGNEDIEGQKLAWLVTAQGAWGTTTEKVSNTCEIIEDVKGCTAEKAVQMTRANPAVTNFCARDTYDKILYKANMKGHCDFKARKSSPFPPGIDDRSDPGSGWLVTTIYDDRAVIAKTSKSCRLINHPFIVRVTNIGSVELGVLESPDIVIGKVVDVQSPEEVHVGGGTKIQTETVTVDVSKVLKGKKVSRISFEQSFVTKERSAKALWLGNDHEMLFLISRGRLVGTKNEDCEAAVHNAGDDETQQEKALQACREANEGMHPVLIGNWPNAIDMDSGKIGSGYPAFSKSGELLKTPKDILDAVQAELAMEAAKPHQDIFSAWMGVKTELAADKYEQAYAAGVPKNSMIVLEVPKE